MTFDGGDLSDTAGELGVLYGRASTGRGAAHGAATVGLSVVRVDLPGPPTGPPLGARTTVGIPLSAEISANRSVVGLGLRGFANLNSVHSFAGLVLMLKLGRLR